jgi:hypothetical protein
MGALRKLQPQPVASPEISQPSSSSAVLLGKSWDLWLVGGASLLVFAGFHLFTPENSDSVRLAMLMYGLSALVNWPHFLLSYQLLYWDRRRELLKKPSYFWAAFIAPALLLAAVAVGFTRTDDLVFSLLVQVMFLTVGWHYVKQTFGTMVVSSATENYFFSPLERRSLLANLYSLWGLSFISGHTESREADFFGLKYDLLGLSTDWLALAYGAVAVTGVFALVVLGKRYLREGRGPSRVAWMSFATLYVWYLPFAAHRHFFYVIPFFHSLQYLLFVGALKKNQWSAETQAESGEVRRKTLFKNVFLYFGSSLALGLIFFSGLPGFLDGKMPQWNSEAARIWSPTVFMGLFQLFINVHHYFIDNVIWKKDNPDLRRYLLRRH